MSESPSRAILHADADAFFVAVEQRDDPRLRGRPVVVADQVVCCAGYEARAHGVRSGMSTRQATRACPSLVVVPPSSDRYVRAGEQLLALFGTLSTRVEPGSMEEAFLDVSGQETSPVVLARRLRRRAADELGLPVSVGVAGSRLWAKVASRRAKPDGVVRLGADEVDRLRQSLPLAEVWSVGARTVARLEDVGVRTLGGVAELDPVGLRSLVGTQMARRLRAVVTGTDTEPVRAVPPRRTFSAQRVLDRVAAGEPEAVVGLLADRVGRRARAAERAGDTLSLDVRDDAGAVVRETMRLDLATHDPQVLAERGAALLRSAVAGAGPRPVTLLRLTLSGLSSSTRDVQLALPLLTGDSAA